MDQLFTIESAALPEGTHVVSFRGSEGLSQLYQFDIAVLIGDTAWSGEDAVAGAATLRMERGDKTPTVVHGVIAAIEHVQDSETKSLFQLAIVPKLYWLTQTHHSRVFVDKSVPEVVEQLLKDSGLSGNDFELKMRESYPAIEHIGQYQESDYAFVSRLLEREGMYFFFEHGDGGEKLIITDCASFHQPIEEPVRYFAGSAGDTGAGESLSTFAARLSALPTGVQVADYDYNKPDLDLLGDGEIGGNSGKLRMFGENFKDGGTGARVAKVRSEEMSCRKKILRGHGRVMTLRAGYTFEVSEHPRDSYNAKHLVTRLEHYGNQSASGAELKAVLDVEFDEEYRVDVLAIPADAQFRAPRKTRKPRIYGMEGAVVDGPADSEFAQIDDQGRYKVRMLFDESGLDKGEASTWVRMLQPHAGNPEGFHFPLRKGTEVMVAFQGGDPDRPFIAGALPNPQTVSPVTSENNTQNVIRTGGNNLIRMEDKGQHIFISTPPENTFVHMGTPLEGQNLHLNTDGNGHLYVGGQWWHVNHGYVLEEYKNNFDTIVDGDRRRQVLGSHIGDTSVNHELTVGVEQHTTVGTNQTLKVGANRTNQVGGSQTTTIAANRDITMGGNETVTVGASQSVTIGGEQTFTVAGTQTNQLGANQLVQIGGNQDTTVGGNHSLFVGGKSTTTVIDKDEITTGVTFSGHLGATLGVFGGLKGDISLSGEAKFAVAAVVEVVGGIKGSVFLGVNMGLTGGIDMSAHVGPKFDQGSGRFKMETLDSAAAALHFKV